MTKSFRFPFLLAMMGYLALGLLAGCGRRQVDSISNADPAKIHAESYVTVQPGDWPWWSGPSRNFQAEKQSVPVKFNESENLVWKYTIDGEGHSSPIVVGDNVLFTLANLEAKTKSLACLDRKTGTPKWETELHSGRFMNTHGKNSQASATPASDGKLVFTVFMIDNGLQVSAVNLDGDLVWQTTAGSFVSRHGFGSSLIIYKSLVIAAGDNPGSGFITALDRDSGEIVWRIARTNNSSYATPTIVKLNGEDQLVISGSGKIHGYDPASGSELWSSKGPAQTTANTIVSDGNLIFSGGGYPETQFYCVDPESAEVRWEANLKSYVPSPILLGKTVVVLQDNGILTSLNQQDGEENWRLRLGEDLSGSAIRAGNFLYVGGEKGTLFVLELDANDPGAKPKMAAKNRLDSRIMSTPAICGDQIFVRTGGTLYCFANSSN